MRIVFMGTPEFAVTSLEKLVEEKHEIVGVFTNPDKPFGRKRVVSFSPVKKRALEYGFSVYQPERFGEHEISILKNLDLDVIVVVAYGKLLPAAVLNVPRYGCFNIHASLLPKYRGASPIQYSIINGDEVTGVSIIAMTPNLDDGDIFKQAEVKIGVNETFYELSAKLSKLGAVAICEVLNELEEGSYTSFAQDEKKASYVYKITKEMARIDFNRSAFEVHKLVCGISKWLTAYCYFNDRMLKVYSSNFLKDRCGRPGELLSNNRFIVGCLNGAVEFCSVQLEGKKIMSAKDFLNGNRLNVGELLK